MSHSCPDCGQACFCDGEDTLMEDEHGMPLEECLHTCQDDDDEGEDE